MGIIGRLKERIVGSQQSAPEAVEPAPTPVQVRADREWSAPEGLGEHEANLATLMLKTRRQVAGLSASEALGRIASPFGWESEALVPQPGPAREGWSDERMFKAIRRDGDFMTLTGDAGRETLDAIDRQMVKTLAHEPDHPLGLAERSYQVRSEVTSRVVDFMKDGPRLEERVVRESEMLERQSSSILRDRFRDMPIHSLEPMPDRGETRRKWLADALRAEHMAASVGLMTPAEVVRAAMSPRGPVAIHSEPAPDIRERSHDLRAETAKEAAPLVGMSDPSLRLRFRDVPGIEAAYLPQAGHGGDRRLWVETVIMIQKLRGAMDEARGTPRDVQAMNRPANGVEGLTAMVKSPVQQPQGRSFAVANMMRGTGRE